MVAILVPSACALHVFPFVSDQPSHCPPVPSSSSGNREEEELVCEFRLSLLPNRRATTVHLIILDLQSMNGRWSVTGFAHTLCQRCGEFKNSPRNPCNTTGQNMDKSGQNMSGQYMICITLLVRACVYTHVQYHTNKHVVYSMNQSQPHTDYHIALTRSGGDHVL